MVKIKPLSNMKRYIMLALMALLCYGMQAKDKDEFRYEVVSAGVGTEGSELIKVFSYAKNQKKAIEIGKKNAVHAILFKGVPGSNGNYTKPAMVKPQDKTANKEFFDEFFKSGQYLQFVSVSNDGAIDPEDMLRVGGEYKIGIIYSVSKDNLRKYLTDNNIIKSLGF